MRARKLTYEHAKMITFSIIYLPLMFAVTFILAKFFNPDAAVMVLPMILVFIIISAGSVTEENIYFWEKGFKRKFRMYEGYEGKTFVETKVGFFWIPLRTSKDLYNRRNIPMEFSSTQEAMDYIYEKRGYSAAKPAGNFKC